MFWNFDVDHFIIDAIPYIAPTVLLLGSIARYERDLMTLKFFSSQLLRRK